MNERERQAPSDEELILLACGELPEARAAELLAVISADPDLARRLETYRKLLAAPHRLPPELPGEAVLRGLRRAARRQPERASWTRRLREILPARRLAYATVAVALLWVGWLLFPTAEHRQPGLVADLFACEIEAGLDGLGTALTWLDPAVSRFSEESPAPRWTAGVSDVEEELAELRQALDELSGELEIFVDLFPERG